MYYGILFSGQGAQRSGLGVELMADSLFSRIVSWASDVCELDLLYSYFINELKNILDIDLPIKKYYGSYNIFYTFNKVPYNNAACFASIYHNNIDKEFDISFYINPNQLGTNACPFDQAFIKYYLNILQEYFNFSYVVKLCEQEYRANWIEIKCHVYTPGLGSLKTFTTAVRFLFEESRSTMLLIALYYLTKSEENVNLFTILTLLEKCFTHNSGHGLTYGDYLYLSSKDC